MDNEISKIDIIIKDLIKLSDESPSRIAVKAGLHRTGLLRWLKGGSDLGEKAKEKLLLALGVFGGTLSPHLVHSWVLKTGDLSPLIRVLKWANKEPFSFEMIYFAPKNLGSGIQFIKEILGNIFSRFDLINFPLLIRSIEPLSSSPIRIVIRRFPSHLVPVSSIQDEDVLIDSEIARWSEYGEIFMVEESLYKKFPEKNISIEEYDQVWDQLKDAKRKGSDTNWRQFSWQEFIREMEKRGITPEEALKSITDKKRNG